MRLKMSKTIRLMAIFLLTITAISFAYPIQEQLDAIAAIVNNEIITQSEFKHALSATKQQLINYHVPIPNEKVFRKQVMEQLIYQKLQLEVAKQNKIKVSEKEINQTISRIAAQNRLSELKFKEKLNKQGISYQEFRNQIRKEVIISKLQQQALANKIYVTKSDLVAFQTQHLASIYYHIATILIPVQEGATQNQINHARKQAFLILKQLHKGVSFKSMMSSHPGSSDLGWRTTNDLPQVFANLVTKIKPNEIAGPIQAPNGFHLVKLLEKKQEWTNLQIKQAIYRQKFQKALQQWLKQLCHSSYIRIYIS